MYNINFRVIYLKLCKSFVAYNFTLVKISNPLMNPLKPLFGKCLHLYYHITYVHLYSDSIMQLAVADRNFMIN